MLIKLSETSAYSIQIIRIQADKGKPENPRLLSIRQMYATKRDPEWKPSRNGITIPLDSVSRLLKAITKVVGKDETVVITKEK